MASPPVSVLIPTYRRNSLLATAIQSAIAQDYEGEIEIVVVDSCPSGTAQPVVDEFTGIQYYKQVDYFSRVDAATHNAARCRDIGITQANGEYVHFLDDDDALRSNTIRTKIDAVCTSEAGGAYNALEKADGRVKYVPSAVVGNELAFTLTNLRPPALPSQLLVRKDILLDCPPRRRLPHGDIAGLIEILGRTDLVYVDQPLTIRNEPPELAESVASQIGRMKTYEQYEKLRTALLPESLQVEAQNAYENIRKDLQCRGFET